MADRVFEDRLGLYVIDAGNLGRLPAIRAFGVKDVFLPRTANPPDVQRVRDAGLYAHLWAATDGLTAQDYANRTLLDIQRLKPGAAELNLELPSDPPLKAYIRKVVGLLRTVKPNYRFRINVAPFKGFALPADLLQTDPHLYAGEQSYYGDMSRVAESDALYDLLSWGVPLAKATVCYGAAALIPRGAPSPPVATSRVVGLGSRWTWSNGAVVGALRRGVIFSDDLMADMGLL
jgi:hypothetical protein